MGDVSDKSNVCPGSLFVTYLPKVHPSGTRGKLA